MKKIPISPFLFYSISFLYFEILIKCVICKEVWNIGLLYMSIFTLPFLFIATILSSIGKEKINKLIMGSILVLVTIYFEVQYIFYTLFSIPFSFSTIGLSDQALDFMNIIIETIGKHFIVFGALLIPLFIFLLLNKKIDCKKRPPYEIVTLLIMWISSYLFTFLIMLPTYKENDSIYQLYMQIDDASREINTFGALTYLKIDIKRELIGYEPVIVDEKLEQQEEEISYGYNTLDLDFEKETNNPNIKALNKYFSTATPTKKNEYTGRFKGKNLIFILAEGFNEIAVDENRTPTLYNIVNSSFVFSNFYSPVFLSTTGGEFQATTGLIPTQETLKNWKSKAPTIKYALGNAFSPLGYQVQSYHNWTYTYYKRNVTMNTLGFSNYTACGNGLESRINCKWLPSDIEMVKNTYTDYMGKDNNFVTYYVTVSGHSPYNKEDNIANQYIEELEDTKYSDAVKYYLASQIELDKMLEELINKLKENNELENTIIALVGDHYPYTLSTDEINEVSTTEKDGTIEVNHSNFIVWDYSMKETIHVDKVGSQIDVLPTLLNLFGIEYDSRLIIGNDILSDTPGLAIFSDRSWVSDEAIYNATTKTFTVKPGNTIEDIEAYRNKMNTKVANAYSISKLIIDTDYYEYISRGE